MKNKNIYNKIFTTKLYDEFIKLNYINYKNGNDNKIIYGGEEQKSLYDFTNKLTEQIANVIPVSIPENKPDTFQRPPEKPLFKEQLGGVKLKSRKI